MDRWIVHAFGWTLFIIGGTALYTAMERDPTTGLALAIGTFAVSLGITLVHEDVKRHHKDRGDSER